ncbi:acyl-CoA thioesterase [Nisaea acidiphila]|uniref:Acyl-CoA thioesterase n=1 Tax=Nisaea acidiphila TaxID=1862145 RepID=A0A9J7ARS3_9PROT|nr:thioesterase family protein [Nisaea acidiphila]UUX49570.1 acyl-CoA thioesterase [Nisaea acidiphila]
MTETATFDERDAASYHYWIEENIRFADLDPVGHVNNNAIGVYLETARVTLFADAAGEMYGGEHRGHTWVVARMEVDYLKEMHFPGKVRVGTRIEKLGNSSIVMRQAIFNGETLTGLARVVGVCFNMSERGSMPIPAPVRDGLVRLAGPVG